MGLPSAVTVGSLAVVLAAGAGLVVVSTSAGEETTPISSSPASDPPASTSPPVDPEPEPEPKPRRHQRDDVVPTTLVDVYNNSGISGLAADKAQFLRGAGWNVAATDNWYGDIPQSTVYYPPSLRRQATRLAAALSITRMRPAVAPMQFDRLTVILTGS